MINSIRLVSYKSINRLPCSYQKNNFLTKIKMNLDESFNKEIIEEKNQKESYKIPGKITLGESELTEREKKLKSLADNWKRERLIEEESSKQFLGFTKNAEIINGRLAMFFLTTGLLTEIWTKQTMVGQIDTMFRIVGIL